MTTTLPKQRHNAQKEATSYSRLAKHALLACWLGMVFDGMDTNNFILTLHPALKELLHTSSDAVIGAHGAYILACFMIGWTVGAVMFGMLADKFGRAKVLIITVLLYALGTGACAIADSWTTLAALRFIVGCGIGGEISIGGVILAELWSGRSRLHAVSFLQTGFPCGLLLLALINLLIGHLGWRSLYVIGIIPAVLAIYIRIGLDDSADFKQVKSHRLELLAKSKSVLTATEQEFLRSPLRELFRRENLMKTVVAIALASSVCIGSYAVLSWLPPWINQLTGTAAQQERSYAALCQSIGNILGSACAGFLIMRVGRKRSFQVAYLAALVMCTTMFLTTKHFGPGLLFWTFWTGFFVFAPYTYLFIYIPEIFETRLRATAFAFCIQSGRLACAAACIAGGYLVSSLFNGSYALAGASLSLVYVIGLAATFIMPDSKGEVSRFCK